MPVISPVGIKSDAPLPDINIIVPNANKTGTFKYLPIYTPKNVTIDQNDQLDQDN